MKIVLLTGLTLAACLAVQAADPAPTTLAGGAAPAGDAASVLKTDNDKLGYSIGLQLGSNMKIQPIEVPVESIVRGIRDGMSGANPLMTQEEIQKVQDQF